MVAGRVLRHLLAESFALPRFEISRKRLLKTRKSRKGDSQFSNYPFKAIIELNVDRVICINFKKLTDNIFRVLDPKFYAHGILQLHPLQYLALSLDYQLSVGLLLAH